MHRITAFFSTLATLAFLIPATAQERSISGDTLGYQSRAVVITGTRAETPIERAPVRVEIISGEQTNATALSTVSELLRSKRDCSLLRAACATVCR